MRSAFPLAALVLCALHHSTPAVAQETPTERSAAADVIRRMNDLERYQDFISLTFAYKNQGTKSIQAFQGDVSFLDASGDTIYSAHLKVDGPIAPGKTRREPGRIIRYDPFRPGHQRLRSTPLAKLRVVWQPNDAVFTDGSRLSLVSVEP